LTQTIASTLVYSICAAEKEMLLTFLVYWQADGLDCGGRATQDINTILHSAILGASRHDLKIGRWLSSLVQVPELRLDPVTGLWDEGHHEADAIF
jgi:hypothetical protein